MKSINFMNINQLLTFFLSSLVLASCATMKGRYNRNLVHKSFVKSPMFNSHFTGFALYDPTDSTYLYTLNEKKFFTPASNTKLLTFYSALMMLGDSIPALKYKIQGDSLIFTGTGDPTFLHPDFVEQPIFDLLNDASYQLYYVPSDFEDEPFADGWTWEDYEYYFQPERSGFPIYGNTVQFVYDSVFNSFFVNPNFFSEFTEIRIIDSEKKSPQRLRSTNIFSFAPDTARSDYKNCVPFKTSNELILALLQDTLDRQVHWMENYDFSDSQLAHSRTTYELYAYVLKNSDNFGAEQMLYLCASAQDLDLNSNEIRTLVKEQYLYDMAVLPIWKDGSGLSRYNLVTPELMIELLQKISKEISIQQMKELLPIGGIDGTIKNWYVPLKDEKPYVFAKTGTLSNNHNLTGIIHTKSGKDLFFSFMNNNYPTSSRPIKKGMEKVMRLIYERY